MFRSREAARASSPPRSLWLVIALLVVSALLITVPAVGAPSAGDVCNAASFQEQDELEADKESAAMLVLLGALTSFVAAGVGLVTAARKRPARVLAIALGGIGLAGGVIGLGAAFVTALIVC